MSANDNTVKAQFENDYSRDSPDVQKAEEIPPTLQGCGY
jgi:hypothetical protein